MGAWEETKGRVPALKALAIETALLSLKCKHSIFGVVWVEREGTDPCLFAFSFVEVQLMQSKLHIFGVYNLMLTYAYI